MNMISPINPATGLPMIGDTTTGFDVGGNPYGMNWHSHDHFSGMLFDHGSSAFSSSDSGGGAGFGSPWD